MPSLKDFASSVQKRSCAIKALLLDQSFSAGVGNWVAGIEFFVMFSSRIHTRKTDEVLYQSGIHPEQRANSLEMEEMANLHRKIIEVCQHAVELNANSSLFPKDWLFGHRWVPDFSIMISLCSTFHPPSPRERKTRKTLKTS